MRHSPLFGDEMRRRTAELNPVMECPGWDSDTIIARWATGGSVTENGENEVERWCVIWASLPIIIIN